MRCDLNLMHQIFSTQNIFFFFKFPTLTQILHSTATSLIVAQNSLQRIPPKYHQNSSDTDNNGFLRGFFFFLFFTVIAATWLQLVMESVSQNDRTNYIRSVCLITVTDSQTDGFYSYCRPVANSIRPLCSVISKSMLLSKKLTISNTQCETGRA